jgi:hypothetical protein
MVVRGTETDKQEMRERTKVSKVKRMSNASNKAGLLHSIQFKQSKISH